jgi:hypothetical protein
MSPVKGIRLVMAVLAVLSVRLALYLFVVLPQQVRDHFGFRDSLNGTLGVLNENPVTYDFGFCDFCVVCFF